jgi:hypothetical protein
MNHRIFRAHLLTAHLLATVIALIVAGCRTPAPSSERQSAPHPAAAFENVAASAGLNYRWEIKGPRPLNILDTIGNGCAFLDYDGDGNLDILLVGQSCALYKGDGKSRFTDVNAEAGIAGLKGHFLGCAVGDYDNDGYEDIYLTGFRTGVLLHNEAGKRFRDVTRESGIAPQPWGTSASFADVNNDGFLDLIIANYVVFGPEVQPQLCTMHGKLTACPPVSYKPLRSALYLSRQGKRFEDASAKWGLTATHGNALGVAAADYNGNGHADIAVANDGLPSDLLVNQGDRFKESGQAAGMSVAIDGNPFGGMGVDWGDYDNDGKLDLFVATFQNQIKMMCHNEGNDLFTPSAARLGLLTPLLPYVTFGAKFFDFDNDGWLDLALTNGHIQDNIAEIEPGFTYRQPTLLLHNEGGARFTDVSAQAGSAFQQPLVGRGLAVGDYDNDGRLDMLIVDSEGAPLLLHNQTPAAGHWLLARLEGIKSNRDGIGATVTFLVDGKRLARRCATDGSYLSASDRRVHCGLGSATKATVEVHWPSGAVETHPDIPADTIITLREGEKR